MKNGFKNLATRTLSGVVLFIVVVGAILSGKFGFGLLFLAITIGGMSEVYRMSKNNGNKPQYLLGILSGAALYVMGFDLIFFDGQGYIPLLIFLALAIPTMFIVELARASKNPIGNLGSTLLGIIYVALPISMLSGVAILLGRGEWNPWIMIAYILIIWANDSFAYLVGVGFGKHKLCARISPKKSWEGFFGGVVGSILFALLVAYIADDSYLLWGSVALVASTMGVLGDLVESMFKRSTNIKDSGHIMPGHGGWLDRFDALILSTPFVVALLYILRVINKI